MDAPTPYSITEEYDVMIPISTSPAVLSTISLQTSPDGPIPVIPEPSIWRMIAVGFAGLGYAAIAHEIQARVNRLTAACPLERPHPRRP